MKTLIVACSYTLLAAVLFGCGEGGTGGTGYTVSSNSQVLTVGVIKAKTDGDITVNDVTYKTSGSTVEINSIAKSSADLHVGMVATVEGEIDTSGAVGNAKRVLIKDSLRGLIQEIKPDGSLVILNQRVIVNALTKLTEDYSASSFNVGMDLSIMGFNTADGELVASYIDVTPEGEKYSVSGYIKQFDAQAKHFSIGGLTIDYSEAIMDENQLTRLSDGVLVDVDGTLLSTDQFKASRIDIEDWSTNTVSTLELEGFIRATNGQDEFTLRGTTVRLIDATVFEHGSKASITVGIKVHVKGYVQSGILYARRIELDEDESEALSSLTTGDDKSVATTGTTETVTVRSVLAYVDANSAYLALEGLAGTSFSFDQSTMFTGVGSASDLQRGYSVEISMARETQKIVALKLLSHSATEDIAVTVYPSKIESPLVWLFDTPVDLTDVNFNADSLSRFLASLTSSKIYLQGKFNGTTVTWVEADLAN